VPPYVPHQVDIEPVEKPETVYWVDPTHPHPHKH
jgi:hypothetical protein